LRRGRQVDENAGRGDYGKIPWGNKGAPALAMSDLETQLREAFSAHRAGDRASAERIYLQVLARTPEHVDAMHYLGLLRHQQGDSEAGEKLIRRSIELVGDQPNYFNNLGVVLTGKNDFSGAAAAFRQAVSLRLNELEYLRNLGFALERLGDAAGAEDNLRSALAVSPADIPTASRLAQLLRAQQRYDETIAILMRALSTVNDPTLHHELAETYRDRRDEDRAVEHYAIVASLLPNSPEAHNNLAQALRSASRYQEGLDHSRRAVELAPEHVELRYTLATALKDLGYRDEAIAQFQEVLRRSPDHPGANHLLAALTGQQRDRCEADYVSRLFDYYAPTFEEHLTERLHYQGPEVLSRALLQATGSNPTDLEVIDLGCGTGLCGIEFRPMARRLIGIDLSQKMLDLAAKKKCYDELLRGDIADVLRERPASAQLIVAGDVLNYIGDLQPVLHACLAALTAGWLIFFVERGECESFHLEQSGRFSHRPEYVQQLAEQCGFRVLLSERHCLRFDRGQPVHGQVYVLARQATC
jgi:predicted TPR repeat methyltransferase